MGSAAHASRNCNRAWRWSNRVARLCVLHLLGLAALLQLVSGAATRTQPSDTGLRSRRGGSAAGLGLEWIDTELQSGWDHTRLSTTRLLQQQQTTNGTDTDARPLAVRGDRYDPINAFRKYRGGFDIESRHYQASVIFTGVPAFVVAVVWLLVGLLLLCFHPLLLRAGSFKETPKWRFYYWGPLLLAGLVALLSVAVLALLVVESAKFHRNMNAVEATISNTGEQTAQAVFNVTSQVSLLTKLNTSAVGISVDQSGQSTARLDAINQEALRVEDQVADVVRVLHTVFKAIEISVDAGASTEVLLLFLGLGFALLLWRFQSMRRWLLLLTLLCWILTTVAWLGSGLFIVANNVADDSCTAMSEYIQDPESTTLDSILPCSRLQRKAVDALQQIQQGVDEVISQVNAKLSEISTKTRRTIPVVCSPYASAGNISVIDMTVSCPPNTTQIGDLPTILAPLACPSATITLICELTRRVITQPQYDAAVELSAAMQTLITETVPQIQDLARCTFVLDAFSSILKNQCKPAKSALRNVWILLLLLSSLAMLAILYWLTAVKRNRKQPRWGTVIAPESPSAGGV